MSWYDEAYTKRAAITVVNTTPDDPCDVDITIPPDWDDFWDTIDTAANELRVVDADGFTLLAYDVDNGSGGSFSRSSRLGRIRIDGLDTPGGLAGAVSLVWVYYGASGAADASVSVTIASAKNGYVEQARPSGHVVAAIPPRPGDVQPRVRIPKAAGDDDHVWIDLSALLQRRRTATAEQEDHEEVWALAATSYDDTGSSASVATASKTRFVEASVDGRRRTYARIFVTGGTSGENYTVRALTWTARPDESEAVRKLTPAFALMVRDQLEPTS